MKLGLNIKSHTDSIYKLEKRLDPVNPPYMEYYKSTSNTSPTMGSWSKTIPFWENGYFLWTRWVYAYTNGTLEMSDPVLDKTWSIMTDYEASKSWTKRFDELTNYGKVKGIVCDPISGALYFNADYINAGKIKAQYIDIDGLATFNNSNNAIANKIADAQTAASNAQSTADTAVSNAKTAQETANDAKDKAENAQSRATTLEQWRTNTVDGRLNHAYNVVNHWAQDASNDSTTINGGLIQTNTITADKIAVGDFTNYCQLSPNNSFGSYYSKAEGFNGSTYAGYVFSNLRRDICVSDQFPCKKGDVFRVSCKLKCQITADDENGNHVSNVLPQISIYTFKADGSNAKYYIPREYSVAYGAYGQVEMSEVITLTSDTDCYFKVHFQIEAYKNFGGWFTVIDPVVRKMSDGEMIVSGSITGDHIAAKTIRADNISAHAINVDLLADNSISNSKLQDTNYGTSNSWINLKRGTMNLGNKFVWDGNNLGINGNGSFSGNITATSGKIAGFQIDESLSGYPLRMRSRLVSYDDNSLISMFISGGGGLTLSAYRAEVSIGNDTGIFTSNRTTHSGASNTFLSGWDGSHWGLSCTTNLYLTSTGTDKKVYTVNGPASTSDRKAKNIIRDSLDAYDFIMHLKPIKFTWKKGKKVHMGFIAQDVYDYLHTQGYDNYDIVNATHNNDDVDNVQDYDDKDLDWHMSYNDVIAPLVETVQRLSKEVERLKEREQK